MNKQTRDDHISAVIKSNLICCNLTPAEISLITKDLTADILDVLDNYEVANISHCKCTKDDDGIY